MIVYIFLIIRNRTRCNYTAHSVFSLNKIIPVKNSQLKFSSEPFMNVVTLYEKPCSKNSRNLNGAFMYDTRLHALHIIHHMEWQKIKKRKIALNYMNQC